MQSTICEHRDDGKAGGVFRSYEVVKVGSVCVCVCVCVCVMLQHDSFQIERVVNPKVWERYVYRRREVAEGNHNHANERMLFHGKRTSLGLQENLTWFASTRSAPRVAKLIYHKNSN